MLMWVEFVGNMGFRRGESWMIVHKIVGSIQKSGKWSKANKSCSKLSRV